MRVQIKAKQDLINALGAKLATALLSKRTSTMKRLPQSVRFVDAKPAFHLNDGGTLKAYAVDLQNGVIQNEMYCGSSDSAINNSAAQFGTGFQAPLDHALVFIETYWNGRNTSWTLTVVSSQVTKQVEVSK